MLKSEDLIKTPRKQRLTASRVHRLLERQGLVVTSGLVVHEAVIARHLSAELPFMATETILMEAARRGGDRQELHEVIRRCCIRHGVRPSCSE